MTIEEIEARWQHDGASDTFRLFVTACKDLASWDWVRLLIDCPDSEVVINDAAFFEQCLTVLNPLMAQTPTDIAWLIAELNKYKRAHAWFVEHNATNDSSFGCEVCLGSGGDDTTLGHQDSCEWVKAKELKL